jgi:competence CoiA-like predicted nuclease
VAKSLLGNCLRKKKLSVFERNAADFAAIMGFTAKNLTKLQPKTRIFSTDYKSQKGSKDSFLYKKRVFKIQMNLEDFLIKTLNLIS